VINEPDSKRKCSFYERGIRRDLLRTLLAQVKMKFHKEEFCVLDNKSSMLVEDKVEELKKKTSLHDTEYNLVVFKYSDSNRSKTDTFFFYIRCAFAHGSFEVKKNNNGEYIYYLESSRLDKKGKRVITSQMRITESVLLELIELKNSDAKEIRSMQGKRHQ
jgi:hypothetical protein